MSNEIRELNDAELDAVNGGSILGDIAQGVANIANGLGNGGTTGGTVVLSMRKSAGNEAPGAFF